MNSFKKKLFRTVLNYEPSNWNLEFISDFAFIWSVFENRISLNNNIVNFDRIKLIFDSTEFSDLKIQPKSFKSIPQFIIRKETESNDLLVTLYNVDFEISLYPTDIKIGLAKIKSSIDFKEWLIEKNDPDIILLMLIITYRIRNNLFHGVKDSLKLYEQKDLFKIINNFLLEFLQKTKNINFNRIK